LKRPYEKTEPALALALIVLYTAAGVLGAYLTRIANFGELPRTVLLLAAALLLLRFVAWTGNAERYGLRKPERVAGLLWFVPLGLFALSNLCYGVSLPDSALKILSAIVLAVSIGILEELLFRGFLFRSLESKNVENAAVVSSVLFGLFHFIRLFDGAAPIFVLCQAVLSVAVGYLFVTVFAKCDSLLPCIVTHAAFNLCGAFAPDPSVTRLLVLTAAQILIATAYTVILKKKRLKA